MNSAATCAALAPTPSSVWSHDAIQRMLASIRAGLVLVDGSQVRYANPMAATLFARAPASLIGFPVAALIAPNHRDAALAELGRCLDGAPGQPCDLRGLRADGREFDLRLWSQPVTLDGQRLLLVTLTDVSGRPQAARHAEPQHTASTDASDTAERRIHELVNHDEITGLANRTNLLRHLDGAIRAEHQPVGELSLLSIEVPRIGELAGTMGFGAADTLAMAIAARLSELHNDGETIAHLGGGEFALLMSDPQPVAEPAATLARARRRALALKDALEQPVQLGGNDLYAHCRIGMALFPADGNSADHLLEAAQTARLNAAEEGGVAHFRPESTAAARRALQIESALRHALLAEEFSLAYQPQLDLCSGSIVAVEALLRWRSGAIGVVSPAEFIPIAERSGLIVAIGEWVLREACDQVMRWRRAGLKPVRVCVNISPVQFQLGDVSRSVHQALRHSGASAGSLGVELPESALLHDGERVVTTLRGLRAMGVQISLDDFGTGFSSLSRLRTLPIDLIKIDRSFVSDVTAAPECASLARSIINLAHGLKIPVLAEGVESEGQWRMLAANGCDLIQGNFISMAVDADAIADLLRGGPQLAAQHVAGAARPRTLLLVDDEASVLSALKRVFRREGYEVVTAASGAEALERLAASGADVILSDQRMPGMTGVDFLRRVKALHPHTIRMTLSGFADLQSIIDAVNEGAIYKFLMKPWDDDLLREHVKQAFAQKELADDNRRLQNEVASAHANLEDLNQRLMALLAHQRGQAQLMETSAGGLRELVDALPAAVFGLDPDGTLVFINRSAAELVPQEPCRLGAEPGPEVARLLATLRTAGDQIEPAAGAVCLNGCRHAAWLTPLSGAGGVRGELLVLSPPEPAAPAD